LEKNRLHQLVVSGFQKENLTNQVSDKSMTEKDIRINTDKEAKVTVLISK